MLRLGLGNLLGWFILQNWSVKKMNLPEAKNKQNNCSHKHASYENRNKKSIAATKIVLRDILEVAVVAFV